MNGRHLTVAATAGEDERENPDDYVKRNRRPDVRSPAFPVAGGLHDAWKPRLREKAGTSEGGPSAEARLEELVVSGHGDSARTRWSSSETPARRAPPT
jgi:hypothetical protein